MNIRISLLFVSVFFFSAFCFAQIPHCVQFPLVYSELGIPITRLNINRRTFDCVVDLGMKKALSLEAALVEDIFGKTMKLSPNLFSDLSGHSAKTMEGFSAILNINHFLFKKIRFAVHHPWGLYLNTDAKTHPMPNNTLGRDLFLSQKGVLYYSRSKKILKWCDHPLPTYLNNTKIIWFPLKEDAEGIHIPVKDNQKFLDFILDSAATVSLLKDKKCLENEPNLVFLKGINIQNTPIQTLIYRFKFPKDFKSDGLLGDSFFKDWDLIIDTFAQKVGLVFLG